MKGVLSGLEELQLYAKEYAVEASTYLSKEFIERKMVDPARYPCCRKPVGDYVVNAGYSLSRLMEVFPKDTENSAKNSILKTPKCVYYFNLTYFSPGQRAAIVSKFDRFLMANNPTLFPNYHEVLRTIAEEVQKNLNQIDEVIGQIASLNHQRVQEIFGLKELTKKQKDRFVEFVKNGQNDVARLFKVTSYLDSNPETVQIMDLYLLAEHILGNLENIDERFASIIETGYFFDNDMEVKSARNIIAQDKPIDDIEKLFKLVDSPVRSFYLLSRAIGFLLLDFANDLRGSVGLELISRESFQQRAVVTAALQLDGKCVSIRERRLQLQKQTAAAVSHVSRVKVDPLNNEWLVGTSAYPKNASRSKSTKRGKNQRKTSPAQQTTTINTGVQKLPEQEKSVLKPVAKAEITQPPMLHTFEKDVPIAAAKKERVIEKKKLDDDRLAQKKSAQDSSEEKEKEKETKNEKEDAETSLTLEDSEENLVNYVYQPYVKLNLAQEVQPSTTLGKEVWTLLSNADRETFEQLFALKANTVDQSDANRLISSVFRALTDLNYAELASSFLKNAKASVHLFHPSSGKAAQLPVVYMEYRLIPFVEADIIHPDFDRDDVVMSSKILRKRQAGHH